ncbi:MULTISPECIES: zinc ribbon domain-containing protein [Paenibacillus]|uniref:zinc ribbon domain-containing protein n=1 Tax=Paenibacillus TaxID=44249 RepID=UPI0007E9B82B|nr:MULTISPECIES: zinc ribbon domain-containing protein [Paenibacillus]AZH28956.1 transcriptional regulator [Paenibacillus sp. M-152]MBU9708296.1 effector binding domain-containing protein [Paenibacillus sp. AK121]MEE4568283.1 zinc ribbon domain-containing protein [Paenibacillus polymyxa]OAZ48082.1 transcriptional regulator [Paenibacillus polymyxa]
MDKACQSCGMPLENEDQYGTDAQHHKTDEYCKYCYKEGAFVQPDLTMEGMIQQCVPILVEEGMQAEEATSMLRNYLPHLKRWRSLENTELPFDGPIREEYRGEIHLIGLKARTNNQKEQTPHGIIPGMWERFVGENVAGRIRGHEGLASIYGCYTDYENGALGEYTFFIGKEAAEDFQTPDELEELVIPAARYAIFQATHEPSSVFRVWQTIWAWAATGQGERTYTGDFEVYGNPDEPVLIYIAIK